MTIIDRYAGAVRSSNLKSAPDTTASDTDVLGAAGLAAKRHPLALALTRLFVGDNRAAAEIIEMLGDMADAWAINHATKIKRMQTRDIARTVLAWHRDGVCRPCGGHGYEIVPGTRTVGEVPCAVCRGSGKRGFDVLFSAAHVPLAQWMLAEVQREMAKAGPAAMAALAPRLDL